MLAAWSIAAQVRSRIACAFAQAANTARRADGYSGQGTTGMRAAEAREQPQ